MNETIGQTQTGRSARGHRDPDWLADLAAGLDQATRVTLRARPDGLVEVSVAGSVLGFVDHVAPVFVALEGLRPATAVEVAQRLTLAAAVDALRGRAVD